jgi:hypothetical protein
MLWYKSWLDTRWRFLIPLAILAINIWGLLIEYPHVANLLRTVQIQPDALTESGTLGRQILESVAAGRSYRGYVWYQWFRQNLSQLGTLFAVLLGSGSLLAGSSGAGTMFTLSLPASRNQWLTARAASGLAQSLALMVIPSLEIPLLSPTIGQHYAVTDALVHAMCLFIVSAMFFSLAFLLSTEFGDIWRPLLVAGGVAVVLSLIESRYELNGVFRVMSGSTYFSAGSIPWIGLLLSAVLSLAMLYGASVNVARKDF